MRGYLWIIWSFLLALILMMLPLPLWAAWFRPEWLVLVVVYWCIALPHRVSVGTAWLLGLLLDVINGTLIGEHALAMAVVAYIAVTLHRRLRVYPLWQQALWVGGLVVLYQSLIFLLQGVVGQLPQSSLYWLPAMTSMLLWPWIFLLLRGWRRRFAVR